MQIKLSHAELKAAASRMQGTVSDRTLSAIGLKAENNLLTITATDRVLAIYSKADCDIATEGTCFVSGKIFIDLTRELPDGVIALNTDDKYLHISSRGPTNFDMKIPLVTDITWHQPPVIETTNKATLPSDAVAYMVNQVQFCISQESPRAFGTVGFMHKIDGSSIRLVGTDGFRLSYCDIKTEIPAEFLAEGVCLSRRALNEIIRMCQDGDQHIAMSIDDTNSTIEIESSRTRLFIRLSAVRFPNYLGVLPTANLNLVKISRTQLQSMMRRVMLAADKSRALQLCFSSSSLTLRSKTVGSSEGLEQIEIKGYRGPDSELSVNGRYLADVFSAISGDTITVQFKTSQDPIVIVPEQDADICKALHVLVPIRENV
jgi:DNA polymerase III subunit beta